MLDDHSKLGIAQIVFYVPIVVLAIWLIVRNWAKHPRMAWWPMVPFSLMRIAGGPIVIALEKDPRNIGLYIAAIILLNVGAIPLIVAFSGFFRIVLMDNFPPSKQTAQAARILRIAIAIAICLLSAGGGMLSVDNIRNVGRILQIAGYGLFAAILVFLVGAMIRFWRMKKDLYPSSHRVIIGALAASPFLIIRTIYGLLQVTFEFHPTTIWNPVTGSAVAFAMMGLFVEYIVVLIFLTVGFTMPPDRGVPDDHIKLNEQRQSV